MTITLMLSLLPFILAYLSRVVAIVLAFYTLLHRSTAFWSSHTSHSPSLAIISIFVRSVTSNSSISGTFDTPSLFNYKSPRARVTASWPDTRPFTITPPSFLYGLRGTLLARSHS